MTDILFLRTEMRASKARLDAAAAELTTLQNQLLNGPDIMQLNKAILQPKIDAQTGVVNDAQATFSVSSVAYQAAVAADAMHPADPGLPLVLLPVRIETAYLSTAAGKDLVVRVYPDDIHVDSHELELTADELAAGSSYWHSVWGAGPNQVRVDAAWATILGRLKLERAAWSVRALQPAVSRPAEETPADQIQPEPPLPTVATRPGTFTRPARTTLLPDHWRVVGLNNHGIEMFYVEGAPIPDTLDLSFAPPERDQQSIGSPPADLPFHDGSRWLVDLDEAIAVGMAVRIPLTGPDFDVGQLFVLGTSASVSPGESAKRLQSALLAHQYTNGLAFLPPGTSTNNTATTRSAWESAPTIPSPTEIEQARANFDLGSFFQNASVTGRALGVDGSAVLGLIPEGLTDQRTDVTAVQEFLWPALGGRTLSWIYTTIDIPVGGTPAQGRWTKQIDLPFAEELQGHANGYVLSRGTLPTMRIGNQPYGFLPALTLDGWVVPADDPLTSLPALLRTLRTYWLASIGPSLPAPAGTDPDSTMVDILKRVPVCVDIRVRDEADPLFGNVLTGQQLAAAAAIPGLPSNSQLSLNVPSLGIPPLLPVDVVHDGPGDHASLLQLQELLHNAVAVIEQKMTKDEFTAKYKAFTDPGSIQGAPPPDLFINLILDAIFDPLGKETAEHLVSSIRFSPVGFFISVALNRPNGDTADPALVQFEQQVIQQFFPKAKAFLDLYDGLCAVDPKSYDAALRETLDVFSHRLDAWITSLAARRLDDMRSDQGSGLVLGAYGWVENLSPRSTVPDQHYIHAPSMGQAATAAVLRAGYESHGKSGPLAVNLTSRRVRDAEGLAAGVRSGQTLGALLGYHFERGLHEAHLDRLIFGLRTKHPLPLPEAPNEDENGKAALEAIAARNVVDGLSLSRQKQAILADLAAGGAADERLALTAAETDIVSGLLDELADIVDAFGDLLLAESVHHLVAGNPGRAGLTADTAGRGEPVPDRFDVTLTPRSGRPLTWQLGALLPADFRSAATGWRTDRPRAAAEPHVNAWGASMLGNAGSWRFSCVLTAAEGAVSTAPVTLDALGVCALDVIAESSGDPCLLELRIAETFSSSLPAGTAVSVSRTPNPDGTPGFGELLSLTARIRALLGKASPLTPQHLQGADSSTVVGIDVADLDTRAAALEASFGAAVETLSKAAQAFDSAAGADNASALAAARSLRSALIGLADQGVPTAWPMGSAAATDASGVSAFREQAASLLAAVQTLAIAGRPAAPAQGAGSSQLTAWLGAVTEYIQGIIGVGIPLLPNYRLPAASSYAAAFAGSAAPAGADPAAVMVWLRRLSRIRDNISAFHDVLLAAEAIQSTPIGITVAQLPAKAGTRWAALPFLDTPPPKARLALVFSTPAPIDPAAVFCGFVCDTWTEHLPGLTTVAEQVDAVSSAGLTEGVLPRKKRGYEASEVTGMAFKVDTPDAAAPQAVLLAISPDPAKGWSFDVLFDTVKETLELAKIRTVDLGDLLRLGRVLPAIHPSNNFNLTIGEALIEEVN